MKRETMAGMGAATFALVGMLAWMGQGARAQGTEPLERKDDKRTINTNGVGKVRIKPDHARVFFGVQTFASGVKQARGANATTAKQVTDALKALKIPDLKMKSTNLTVELINSEGEGRVPKILGYRVTNTFTTLVRSEDAERLGPLAARVLDTALESGANMVEQVVFFREDDREAKREALVKAVQDARANAHALAVGADRKITDVINIVGQPDFGYMPQRMMMNSVQTAVGGDEGTSLMAGEQEITCTVSVTCSY
jgi:uncharacterized protein